MVGAGWAHHSTGIGLANRQCTHRGVGVAMCMSNCFFFSQEILQLAIVTKLKTGPLKVVFPHSVYVPVACVV